jgi:HTH-type transcriptional regulator/antitoxin HigA
MAPPPARTFAELTALRPLRPIRNESDLDRAQSVADRLAVLNRRTRDQEDYIETLSLLIEAYEDLHHPIDTADIEPIDALRFLMNSHGMNASDLGRLLGNRSLGAAILRGQRQLSKTHIAVLCQQFAVSPSLFLKSSPTARKAG